MITSTGLIDTIYVPISGLDIETKCDWYHKTLLEILDGIELKRLDGPLRIPIFDKMGKVFGKVESGTIRLGDKLSVLPRDNLAQVVGLQDGNGQIVPYANSGENV